MRLPRPHRRAVRTPGGLNAIPCCPSYADLKRMGARYVPESLSIGSGWSLAGWMGFLLESGIDNIVYASTFGCMSGHVVGQGVMRDLRTAYPDANIASIEFDPGISGVNQVNRIKLMASIAKRGNERRSIMIANEQVSEGRARRHRGDCRCLGGKGVGVGVGPCRGGNHLGRR